MDDASGNKQLHVGKVMDAHGIRGDLYVLIFSGDNSWGDNLNQLTLKRYDQSELFKVEKAKAFKKGFILKLQGFVDRNRAEEFKGAEVWVEEGIFNSEVGDSLYLREILNFTVVDRQLGEVGEVRSFSSNGVQDLLVVHQQENIFEVPFVEDFVTSIDHEKKQILMVLPEGLLEINRGTKNED